MDPRNADLTIVAGLRHSSELSKALSDLQEKSQGTVPLSELAEAVGAILAWFDFEMFQPIEQEQPQYAAWTLSAHDWAPGFAPAAGVWEAFDAFEQVSNRTLDVARAGLSQSRSAAFAELERHVYEAQAALREARRLGAG